MRLILSLLVLGCGLLPAAAFAAETFFVRTLGGPDNDRVTSSVMLGDLLYFGGVKNLTGSSSAGMLLATTAEGDVVFEKNFVDPEGEPVEIAALVAGDGTLYAGGTIGTWPVSGRAFLLELSAAGEILSQVSFQQDKQAFLRNLILTSDGGLLLVGALVVPPDTIGNGWVVKLDSTGAIEWQKDIGTGGDDHFEDAAERAGGGYVLAGGLGSSSNPFFFQQGWLVSLDAAGGLLWQSAYAAAVGDFFNALVLDRNGIKAVGTYCDFCFFRGDGWIVDTDLDGNLLAAGFIGDFSFQGFDEIIDVVPAAKGRGVIVIGSSDTIFGWGQQIWAARLSQRGALRWIRHMGGPGFEMAGAIAQLPGGSLLYGGLTVADLDQNAYFGKLDRAGRLPAICTEVNDLFGDVRDGGGVTVRARAGAQVGDATATTLPGTLAESASPTQVDDLVCFES